MTLVMPESYSSSGAEPRPVVLYGYGGWGQSVFPWYDPFVADWVGAGGIYAVANIRGGGEFGREWHEAGRRHNKHNVFDDFRSAADYLVDTGMTTRTRLGIRGFSNGGLLMGVMLTRYPERFGAVSAHIAAFDLSGFAINPSVVHELGDPNDECDFDYLMSYPPIIGLPPAPNIRRFSFQAAVVTPDSRRTARCVWLPVCRPPHPIPCCCVTTPIRVTACIERSRRSRVRRGTTRRNSHSLRHTWVWTPADPKIRGDGQVAAGLK